MMPRLLELMWLMSRREMPRSRQLHPSSADTSCRSRTIDGMLFVGIAPASHHAA